MLDNPMIDVVTELEFLHVIFESGGVLHAGMAGGFQKNEDSLPKWSTGEKLGAW